MTDDQTRDLRRAAAPGMLWRECGWCGAHLGVKPCDPENEGKISHGICDACLKRQAHLLVTKQWG